MKTVPIRCGITGPWMLVELQGTLHARSGDSDPLTNLTLGKLSKNKLDRPVLTIGAHMLEGKVVKLDRPLGIFHKKLDGENIVGYNVIGIIREKAIFKSRPKPLVRNEE